MKSRDLVASQHHALSVKVAKVGLSISTYRLRGGGGVKADGDGTGH